MNNSPIQQLYHDIITKLKLHNIESVELTALFIIKHVFKKEYILLLAKEQVVSDDAQVKINQIIEQRIEGIPLEYIVNEACFNGHDYYIKTGVLIPRPETEELVALGKIIIQWVNNNVGACSVYELGLGSGVISVELACFFPEVDFFGWDISEDAISVTNKNIKKYDVRNIKVRNVNFFTDIYSFLSYKNTNIMISNPPYVSKLEYQFLDKEVLKEPKEALVADNHGLSIIYRSIMLCLELSMIFICEIGQKQKPAIKKRFSTIDFLFLKDLSGHDRFLIFFPKEICINSKFKYLRENLNTDV